jgi:hypothetical protein
VEVIRVHAEHGDARAAATSPAIAYLEAAVRKPLVSVLEQDFPRGKERHGTLIRGLEAGKPDPQRAVAAVLESLAEIGKRLKAVRDPLQRAAACNRLLADLTELVQAQSEQSARIAAAREKIAADLRKGQK